MFERYEIRNVNGEEILYLYVDIYSEFASTNLKKQLNTIYDFIKKNKINFLGTTVAIVAGSTILTNIHLNKPLYTNQELNNTIAISEIIKNDNQLPNLQDESIVFTINEDKKLDNVNTNNIVEDKTITETKLDNHDEITNTEILEDNNTYVLIKRNNGSTLNIELEEYVMGVVATEMPALFSMEALKAQAVIARTYALKSLYNNRILTDTSSTQNYKSTLELKSIWGKNFDTYYKRIKDAVDDTKGMYLSYNGTFIEAVYHSTSNGMTEEASNVWGNDYPYLRSVESEYDEDNPSFIKTEFILYNDLSDKLHTTINESTNFDVLVRSKSNRIISILIGENIYEGTKLRNILGLRSTDFEIIKDANGITFKTKGYGHGVGLSQYGANGYAKNGYSYTWILDHYYPGTTLNHL